MMSRLVVAALGVAAAQTLLATGSLRSLGDQARSEVARLEVQYNSRVAYWAVSPPFGLESDLLGAQHEAAVRFFFAAQFKFLPARRRPSSMPITPAPTARRSALEVLSTSREIELGTQISASAPSSRRDL